MPNLDKLRDEFDTSIIMDAIESLDTIRSLVVSGPDMEPSELQQDLLYLHTALDSIVNEGGDLPDNPDDSPFFLAEEIEYRIAEISEAADSIFDTLSTLSRLAPDVDDLDEDEDDDEGGDL